MCPNFLKTGHILLFGSSRVGTMQNWGISKIQNWGISKLTKKRKTLIWFVLTDRILTKYDGNQMVQCVAYLSMITAINYASNYQQSFTVKTMQ